MAALKPIVAIDGPAGSGKSTIARRVAQRLGLFYIDTGAMYRCLALKAGRLGIDPQDSARIAAMARATDIDMDYEPAGGRLLVRLDGEDVSEAIRLPEVTRHVSTIAKIKEVRATLVRVQRRLARGHRAILEGRDTTTVVFPDAYKKFYLDAQAEERVHRRFLEMKAKAIGIDEPAVRQDIARRDHLDSTREHAPLRRAPDAVYIDTTNLTIEQVTEKVIEEIART
ncbi:MAG: (d)CMP kinase [Deltaproteobacteria bacterium]